MAVITLEELFKSSPRREFQSSNKSKTNNKRLVRNTLLLETLAKNGDITSRLTQDGTVKMKILVKKQDLNQMLEAINVASSDNNDSTRAPAPPPASLLSSTLSSIERRMYDLMKRRRASQSCHQGQHSTSWRPALQSIPEEHY